MIHPNNKQMLRKAKKMLNRGIKADLGRRPPSTPRGTARRKRRA